jgi:hypothetical protein
MLSAMDGNKQEEKLLVVERKSLKWAKANNAPALKITLMSPHSRWDDCDITFTITMIVKQRIFKCIKCMNKGDELYDVPLSRLSRLSLPGYKVSIFINIP